MKSLGFFLSLFFCFGFLHAQHSEEIIEPVSVSIRNDKGKVIEKAFVHTTSAPFYQIINESGVAEIYPKAADIIYVTVNNYVGAIPYAGEKSLEVIFGKNVFSNPSGKVYETTKLPRFSAKKIYKNPNIESYGSLILLIQEKYSSIFLLDRNGIYQAYLCDIHTGQDVVRTSGASGLGQEGMLAVGKWMKGAQTSTAEKDPNAALVFVDDVLYPNIHRASNAVILTELVDIQIDHPDTFSGDTSAGSIHITTLNRKERTRTSEREPHSLLNTSL